MTTHRPAADEAMNRTELVQAGFLTLVQLIFIGTLVFRDRLNGWQIVAAILIAFPAAWLLTKAVRGVSAAFADRFIGGLTSAGNIKYQQTYSMQEALIARGQFDEAAAAFRDHLTLNPDDVPARLRLATLHLRERKDHVAAEIELLAIRRKEHDRSTAQLVANHLVDLYREHGPTGKLMAELTRMIKEWPGTQMAAGAARLLEEVRRER